MHITPFSNSRFGSVILLAISAILPCNAVLCQQRLVMWGLIAAMESLVLSWLTASINLLSVTRLINVLSTQKTLTVYPTILSWPKQLLGLSAKERTLLRSSLRISSCLGLVRAVLQLTLTFIYSTLVWWARRTTFQSGSCFRYLAASPFLSLWCFSHGQGMKGWPNLYSILNGTMQQQQPLTTLVRWAYQ